MFNLYTLCCARVNKILMKGVSMLHCAHFNVENRPWWILLFCIRPTVKKVLEYKIYVKYNIRSTQKINRARSNCQSLAVKEKFVAVSHSQIYWDMQFSLRVTEWKFAYICLHFTLWASGKLFYILSLIIQYRNYSLNNCSFQK